MVFNKNDLYTKVGLLPPTEFLKLQKYDRIKKGFDSLLNNYDYDLNRRTGKTTNLIMDLLFHFYKGEKVIMICQDKKNAFMVQKQSEFYRQILDPEYLSTNTFEYKIAFRDSKIFSLSHYNIVLKDY